MQKPRRLVYNKILLISISAVTMLLMVCGILTLISPFSITSKLQNYYLLYIPPSFYILTTFIMTVFVLTISDYVIPAVYEAMVSPVTGRFIKNSRLQLKHLVKLMHDLVVKIEERNNELNIKLEKAENAGKVKDDYLANISHELRTPMHAILSFAAMGKKKLINNDVDTDKLQEYFFRIEKSGERLLKIINELLDLTKLEQGKADLSLSCSSMIDCIEGVIKEIEPRAIDKNIHITFTKKITNTKAIFDYERMFQVVVNILSNAIKFSPKGKDIEIVVEQILFKPKNSKSVDGISVSILDEGEGVKDSELEIIFDKFIRSEKNKNSVEGSGLGLAICREIINAHNGKIWAENVKGKGCKVTFVIPMGVV